MGDLRNCKLTCSSLTVSNGGDYHHGKKEKEEEQEIN